MKFFDLINVITLLILSYFGYINAYLNLYLSLSEVQRLLAPHPPTHPLAKSPVRIINVSTYLFVFFLGLPAELYYIRNGNINTYALNFVVPIPPKIDSLHFTWESLTGQPTRKVDEQLKAMEGGTTTTTTFLATLPRNSVNVSSAYDSFRRMPSYSLIDERSKDLQDRIAELTVQRFAVMAYCWAMSAEERPTFTQLHVCLQEFYAQLTRYV
ncbi:hypothetical protein NQ317_009776 [Molorchus minor]|uniref:WIF domain-containing protein n=1 Tax=Molorchus minor TaxID=1323400 RepID=A0ABQ9K3Y6_9CUCU|nr:hypothetical protein NQ317_009776 [Molorchus minor]